MAPTGQLLRLAALEDKSTDHEVKLAVLTESHDRLERDVAELAREMKATNDAVANIKLTIAQWSVGVAVIIAAGTAIGGWFIKTSLDALKTSLVSPHKP